MAGMGRRTYLRDVNPYLVCPLCRGYLIDATTVVECLHSFCRSCILKHLSGKSTCPTCNHVLNKAKPNIKADKALQDIVYKLVPGLYHKEMRRRREFYKKHPEHDSATPEQRGEDVSGRLIFAPEDAVSLSLEYLPPGADPLTILLSTNDTEATHHGLNNNNNNNNGNVNRRYLQCPALVTIAHLKKFLALKYSVDLTRYLIEVCHRRAPLPEHWTLMDVAYIYAWKRNAPMRFFYRIAQEEPWLEAPPHERPSTPGLGASLPPADTNLSILELKIGVDSVKKGPEDVSKVPNRVEPVSRVVPNIPIRPRTGPRLIPIAPKPAPLTTKKVKLQQTVIESRPIDKAESNNKTSPAGEDGIKQIKSPIKILKHPDGQYEVLKSPSTREPGSENSGSATDPKAKAEFSVVSIGGGQNSNGVKITLKQLSPSGTGPKKPQVISDVLLRRSTDDKDTTRIHGIQQLQQGKEREGEKLEKQRRRVTFSDGPVPIKSDGEFTKKPMELPDKNQFLQSFQLTAKESGTEPIYPGSKSIVVNNATTDAISKATIDTNSKETTDGTSKATGKTTANASNKPSANASSKTTMNPSSKATMNPISKIPINTTSNAANNGSNNTPKVDVYAFPSDPSPLPPGAVKRKCPPGLPIFESKRKRQHVPSQPPKKVAVAPYSGVKSPQKAIIEPANAAKNPGNTIVNTAITSSPVSSPNTKSSPKFVNNTRNLLDGCGLNIPSSLSITLTAPKSPGSSPPVDPCNSKDSRTKDQNILNKLNPSITLNDRSVDPRVLKALKSGQIQMPAPPKPKGRISDREAKGKTNAKRKREQELGEDALDLSGGKKIDLHPLRIPQPVSKPKGKGPTAVIRDNITSQGQVVTLMGGQRYYRAPPGSLTPAAHRVSDCPLPAPPRTPVYAPSCLSSPPTNSRANLSSVFPSLQSLYALSQAQNLQHLHMEARLRLPRIDANNSNNSGKSHLAAQCAPIKPARCSIASLAVPIIKTPNGPMMPSPGRVFSPSSKGITPSSGESPTNSSKPHTSISQATKTASPNNRNSISSTDKTNQPIASPSHTRPTTNLVISSPSSTESHSREAASPRVTSTASPSPPPSNVVSISNVGNDHPVVASQDKSIPCPEVTSSKSPASPDSSSALPESSGDKPGVVNVDQVSTAPPALSTKSDKADAKPSEDLKQPDDKVTEKDTHEEKHKTADESKPKDDLSESLENKQMTSEMFHKRLLAAFPSNEWANNPIAAEHLGNFLKSLTSMQPQNPSVPEITKSETSAIHSKSPAKDDITTESTTESTTETSE